MASPLCEVQDGAGAFEPTTDGVDITPAGTFKIRLVSTADVDSWSISCFSTDELGSAEDVALVIDPVTKSATGVNPVAGRALLFRSQVNGGLDRNNVRQASYTTTFGLYTLCANGMRVHAALERMESHHLFGWMPEINALIRAAP